ncbi:4589_t:CDS:2, partial [Scutellospora calospora]
EILQVLYSKKKMADLNNIQLETEQTIHQDSQIRSNLKRKNSDLENKSGRKLHKILENNQVLENQVENYQVETAETLFQEEINKKRRKYKRIILENVVIEDDLFNLFITGLDAENIIIQK